MSVYGQAFAKIRGSRGTWGRVGGRYVIYAFATALHDPARVIAEPGGYLIAPRGGERVGDVSNVVFTNGAIAAPDGPVTFELAQRSVTAEPEGGRFLARLPALPAGGPHALTVRCGQECVTLFDVMVGEVWLCGGLCMPEGDALPLRVEGAETVRMEACGDALVLTLKNPGPIVRVRYA